MPLAEVERLFAPEGQESDEVAPAVAPVTGLGLIGVRNEMGSGPSDPVDSAAAILGALDRYSFADNLSGARAILPIVEAHTDAALAHLRSGQGISPEYISAVGRLAEFRGWLYHDQGQLDQAMLWTNTSLDLAYEADNERLVAYAWMRKSNVASDARRPRLAIAFARRSREDRSSLTPRMLAVSLRQEAHAEALNGEYDVAARLIDDAHAAVDRGEPGEDFVPYCTTEYVEMEAANSWIELGRHGQAIPVLQSAIDSWPDEFQRDRSLCLARLCLSLAGNSQPVESLAAAEQALELNLSTRSARTVEFLWRAVDRLDACGAKHEEAQLRMSLAGPDTPHPGASASAQ